MWIKGSNYLFIAICVALRRQHPSHCVWFWLPQRKREFEELNLIQQRVTNMGGALDRRSGKPVEFPSLQIVNT